MRREELLELIQNGEDSGLELKRDDVTPQDLAKEIVAFLNLDGGILLLGVEDHGTVSGTLRERPEEWVAELCRRKIEPPIIPYLSWARDVELGKHVLAVRVPAGPDKPYARVHNDRRTYFVRVGSTCREASREELERMFQASGRLQYGLKPVPGATYDDLDSRRLRNYLEHVSGASAADDDDIGTWKHLLTSLDLMVEAAGRTVPTIDGMLLFGRAPKRFLPQSGIRALAYSGLEASYATRADRDLEGPLVPLLAADGTVVESGLVEQGLDFIRRHTEPTSPLENGRRIDRPAYPEAVLREALVNALVHRDYSIAGSDVTLALFADRLEIQSPGRLPNTVTVDGMKAGLRYARNQNLVNILRDYGYVDFRGMGVREKIIPGMRDHNGTEPDLVPEEQRFTVRLWSKGPASDA
ncbi:MAG: putative DNA binding domain-containing protein [Holophagales bacterium]|nr:putative DNA binding domain-containing protein [Holophagales bacterium]